MYHFLPEQWKPDNRTGKGYMILHTESLDHKISQAKCQLLGGKLPEPRDEKENQFVNELGTNIFLLGINKIKGDEWRFDSDGSRVIYNNWEPGHPDSEKTGKDCAIMERSHLFPQGHRNLPATWIDVSCKPGGQSEYSDRTKHLVCESAGGMYICYYLIFLVVTEQRS